MGIIKTAASLWWPPSRKKLIARDDRYLQARALGSTASDFKDRVAIIQMKCPQLSEIEAMDEVLEQLRKGQE